MENIYSHIHIISSHSAKARSYSTLSRIYTDKILIFEILLRTLHHICNPCVAPLLDKLLHSHLYGVRNSCASDSVMFAQRKHNKQIIYMRICESQK